MAGILGNIAKNLGFGFGDSDSGQISSYVLYPKNDEDNEFIEQKNQEEIPSSNSDEDFNPVNPINDTDPIVRHDPIIEKNSIVTIYQPDTSEEYPVSRKENIEMTTVDGIQYPLININGVNISPEQIKYMYIDYRWIIPTINLIIYDPRRTLKNISTPGINNKITVIMLPEVNGAYRSISIDFYITDYNDSTDNILYSGKLLCLPLEQKITGQIKYVMPHAREGCVNQRKLKTISGETYGTSLVSCNLSPQNKPNTWEYLHEIAAITGLGFASTHQCREIPDRLPRILRNKTYLEFIEDQILKSGINEDSCFDVWIDLYRYIVMVNVSWVLNSDIKHNQLTIKAIVGKNGTDKDLNKAENKEVFRTLTSFEKMGVITNLEFKENKFKEIVDNNIHDTGIHVECPVMQVRGGSCEGNGNKGVMNIQNVMAQENSVDGSLENSYMHQTSKQTHVTIQVDPYNTNYQQLIRTKFFEIKRAKYYTLELTRPNLGLQRGTLINVLVTTSDAILKRKIMTNASNLTGENADSTKEDNMELPEGMNKKDMITDENNSIPNIAKSGMYYIDGMTFEYSRSEGRIIQVLYLIKKDIVSNLQNITTMAKFNENALGEPTENKNDNNTTNNNVTENNTSEPQNAPYYAQLYRN